MELHTTLVERVLHLGLFVGGAAVVGVLALVVLDRIGDGERRVLSLRHVLIPVCVFAAFGIAERIYHALH